jgi:dTDP-glucose 4,6-dehydratase
VSDAFRPQVVVVTGGAGFIGSNLCRWLLTHEPQLRVVNYDLLTYAGNLESLADVESAHGGRGDGRYFFLCGDVRDAARVGDLLAGRLIEAETGRAVPAPDTVLHLAAESHVDRSILAAGEFVSTNVQGTHTLLACLLDELRARPRSFRFVNVSTDEVYGTLRPGDSAFTESTPLRPNSPYSASKAGADCLVRAYVETFELPCITTRCSNNYGPYQFPEKLIPLMISKALGDEPLPVYGDGLQRRDWLHVLDHASAIWAVCTRGRIEDGVYNIGGESEHANIDIVRAVLQRLGKPERLIRHVADRAGHDRRYAMDITRIRDRLGWAPRMSLDQGLDETVAWYLANERWWRSVQSEAYRAARTLYAIAPGA